MKKLLELITEEFEKAFEKCDYDKKLGKVSVSNRPDLCEYQCNGAMAGAKLYHKAPIMIANDVVEAIGNNGMFKSVEAVNPGFININLNSDFLAKYLNEMKPTEKGIVKKITTDGKIKRRLYDMGVTPGAQIIVKKLAPLGDPIEVTIRGYELTVRKSEAECVLMEEMK